jgi:hypothetical protein
LYTKKILKKETSINNEKIIICEFWISIVDRSFTGKKPPDEIMVIAKFSELNNLIPNKLRITKITNVKLEYKINILIVCFKTSVVLNDKKFVRDFFKFSS